MVRRLIAAIVLALPLAFVAASPSTAIVQAQLTAGERHALDRAEAALSDVRSLKARFEQVTSRGGYAQGTVMIQRPGRMRLEYDAPADVLIVADGRYLIYADLELRQVSHIGLDKTPAGLLLRETVSFDDPDVVVTRVRRHNGMVEIEAVMADEPASGQLTLVFEEEPFALRQWRVLDADGVETTVVLRDVQTGLAFDKALFKHIPNADALPR